MASHTPVLFTGARPIRMLLHQPVRLFSDVLLHDMGAMGDGDAAVARDRFRLRKPAERPRLLDDLAAL